MRTLTAQFSFARDARSQAASRCTCRASQSSNTFTMSATSHSFVVTPAAIAGVQRRVVCSIYRVSNWTTTRRCYSLKDSSEYETMRTARPSSTIALATLGSSVLAA